MSTIQSVGWSVSEVIALLKLSWLVTACHGASPKVRPCSGSSKSHVWEGKGSVRLGSDGIPLFRLKPREKKITDLLLTIPIACSPTVSERKFTVKGEV